MWYCENVLLYRETWHILCVYVCVFSISFSQIHFKILPFVQFFFKKKQVYTPFVFEYTYSLLLTFYLTFDNKKSISLCGALFRLISILHLSSTSCHSFDVCVCMCHCHRFYLNRLSRK